MNNQSDDRTTPVGMLHYAHSYAASAQWLDGAQVQATHPDAPIKFNYTHAIELYLKAFLLQKGVTVQELRSRDLGHDTANLVERAVGLGLNVSQTQKDHISFFTDAIRDRYIETGYRRVLEHDALHALCVHLDGEIGPFIYKENGLNHRRYPLEPRD